MCELELAHKMPDFCIRKIAFVWARGGVRYCNWTTFPLNPPVGNQQLIRDFFFFFFKFRIAGSSHRGAEEMNPTRNYEVVGQIPGLGQWVKDPVLP